MGCTVNLAPYFSCSDPKVIAFRYLSTLRANFMSGLLIKDFPAELHRKLKDAATRNHRSMTRHALALLEQALSSETRNAAELLPKPLKPLRPVRTSSVVTVIRDGRKAIAPRIPKK